MKKITLCFALFFTAMVSMAQHSFGTISGPELVAGGSSVTLNVNDAANSAAVPAGEYASFTITVDWANDNNAYSSEADLTVITSTGSVLIDPPTSGQFNSSVSTVLTFSGGLSGIYDPSVDGTLNLILNQSWITSSANWSNIVVTLALADPVPECASTPFPADLETDVATGNMTFTWSAPASEPTPTSYNLYAGLESDGSDLVLVGNFETESAALMITGYNTTIYWMVVPLNGYTEASGCDLWSFTTGDAPVGVTCDNPIVVDTIPYSSDSDTAEYGNAYVGADLPSFVGAQYTNGTGSASYLSGNDAVYAFTPTEDGSFNFVMTAPTADWYSLWLFEGCAPFTSTVAYHTSTTGATRTLPEIQLVAGTTYYVVISTWAAPQTTPYNLTITQNTCTNATVSYTTVNDCDNSGGFMVNVAVTDMGTAANITLSDNQGNDTQAVTEVGNYLFGPYTNGTAVVITVTDDDDANCVQNSTSITQVACPPDNITCATAFTVNCGETIEGTSVGSTGTAEGIGCGTFGVNGVWYSFTGTGANITVTTTASFDHRMGIAVGDDCGSLTNIVCRDASTQAETYEIPNTTLGATYYVYIAHYASGNTTTGTHSITIECAIVPEDAPECATGLVSTLGDCGSSDTTLSWEAVDLAAGYYVTVGTTPGGNDVLDSEDVSGTSVSVSQTASTTYYWTVVPYNVVGSADGCEEMSYTTGDTPCYCTAGGGGTLEKISNVTLINIVTSEEVINNNSTSTGNYENFTSVVGNVNRESTYSFTASFTGTSYPNDQVIVWIDYNQDGDFDDEGEQVLMTATSTSPWSGTIEIPATAEIGLTRMRVRLHDANLGPNITPCGNSNWGQVEDYTLNIGEPLSTGDYNLNSFTYYPNPVNDVLNLSAQNAIQHISVYNLLGQEVLTKQLNVNVAEVDMTGLPSGHYLVRVTSENVTKTVKVVKL
ncbi:MAG: GEVED domain-containing protein [Flavobacteriaceae bacterium]|jgi:hypothetical protein|nr:GEVED domain-containing protein [Flavobacteriaceae bacterium]